MGYQLVYFILFFVFLLGKISLGSLSTFRNGRDLQNYFLMSKIPKHISEKFDSVSTLLYSLSLFSSHPLSSRSKATSPAPPPSSPPSSTTSSSTPSLQTPPSAPPPSQTSALPGFATRLHNRSLQFSKLEIHAYK